MEEENFYTVRSEEVQEVLGTPPSGLVQWGTLAIFLALGVLGAGGWFLKSPDKIIAELTLTTQQPPVPVFSRTDGYIDRLWVADGDSVTANTPLVALTSQANMDDVLQLENDLEELQEFDQEAFLAYVPDESLRLGEIQADYDEFLLLIRDFSFIKQDKYDRRTTRRLKRQIENIREEMRALDYEFANASEAATIVRQQFEEIHKRYDGNIDQLSELQDAKEELLAKEQEVGRIEGDIAQKKQQIAGLNVQILAIQQGEDVDNMSKYQELRQSIATLSSKIESWKQTYLLVAPAAGIVSFYRTPQEQEYIQQGDRVLAIIPYQEYDNLVGEVQLPIEGSGKVEMGQAVQIKFASYPFQEFGLVKGVVESKSLLPKDNKYFVKIGLPNGLQTTYGEELAFRQQMKGTAEIVTGDKRFLERALEKLLDIFRSKEEGEQ